MSNYANEAGEPYMTAAQLRFEAELDAQSAEERYYDEADNLYGDEPEEGECCANGDLNRVNGVWVCAWCGEEPTGADADTAGIDNFGGEDSWLDGSYEE